jgi:cell wall-associated NlpC family hydrolase
VDRPKIGLLAAGALGATAAIALGGCSDPGDGASARTAETVATAPTREPGEFDLRTRPQAVDVGGAAGRTPAEDDGGRDGPSPGAPSDDEVRAELRAARAELRDFKAHLASTAYLQTGPEAGVLPDGTAIAPEDAPEPVKRVILAANQIAKFPYKWGGGHGAWRDNGYDCSGSVSFALAGAGLLDRPLTSGLLARYGEPGRGDWITIFANPGHVFMVVAGLRFDTSGRGREGTRWQRAPRGATGFAVRHVPGL